MSTHAQRTSRSALVMSMMLATTSACYNTFEVPHAELGRLNGFRKGQSRSLQAWDGQTVRFDAGSNLSVQLIGGPAVEHRYSQVNLNGTVFSAVVSGSGQRVELDLSQAGRTQVSNLSIGKTVGLAVGLPLSIGLLLGIGFGVASALIPKNLL